MKKLKLILVKTGMLFYDGLMTILATIGASLFFLYCFGLAGLWLLLGQQTIKEEEEINFWAYIIILIFNLLVWVLTLSFLWLWMIK